MTSQTKVFKDAKSALFDLRDGISLMSGGFGLCGIPENSIREIVRQGIRDIHAISNNIGNSGRGLAMLLKQHQISRATCSYVGGNPDLESQMLSGEVETTLVPQGTFSERIRAAGMGIRAFYTPAGAGTLVAEGKEVREFDRPCVLEYPLPADFAIIKAEKGDIYGNLWFKETARNFSPLMAMAAKTTVVEVEQLVELGQIPAEDVHLPGVFVQRIYQGQDYENVVEIPVYAPG
ncbi:MAG: CoA transferase subunit A [Planctomycetota bacterium]|nr:CoA transferase subunit A [Planctomycetota bacterium]